MKRIDYEKSFAKIIIISVVTFLLLFYGNRYSINYIYVVMAETSLFLALHNFGLDNGQETLTGLIVSTVALMISVLCSQKRMDLPLVIITYLACLLGDVVILYSEQTRFGNKIFPFYILGLIYVSNFHTESYIKLGIGAVGILIVVLYAIYFYRATIHSRFQKRREERKGRRERVIEEIGKEKEEIQEIEDSINEKL